MDGPVTYDPLIFAEDEPTAFTFVEIRGKATFDNFTGRQSHIAAKYAAHGAAVIVALIDYTHDPMNTISPSNSL